jgi:Prenyltransferase and squalene oxidase repeat
MSAFSRTAPFAPALAVAAVLFVGSPAPAQEPKKSKDTEVMVEKGLEWLKRNQQPDGSWLAPGGQYTTAMTALAGLALVMEGSTSKEGKYSDNIAKAVDWFMKRSQNSGLLGTPASEGSRYTYGHGFGMLFLACVYGEEEDPAQRKKLEALLKRAVEFSGKAQTRQGGWGYVSAADGNQFDEGSTTITQLQGLRACRNAGIVVPKSIIDSAVEYLRKSTTSRGGVIYNLGPGGAAAQAGGERPAITAAAVACGFSSGNYDDKYAKMWIKYCKDSIWQNGSVRGGGFDDYQNYYFGQAVYVLGDDRYGKLFPEDRKDTWITWSKFKENTFAHFASTQASDGSWNGGYGGSVISTAFNLTLLQLEKNLVPFYHR